MATRVELEEEIAYLRGELREQKKRLALAHKTNRKIMAENRRFMRTLNHSKLLASVINEIKAVVQQDDNQKTEGKK